MQRILEILLSEDPRLQKGEPTEDEGDTTRWLEEFKQEREKLDERMDKSEEEFRKLEREMEEQRRQSIEMTISLEAEMQEVLKKMRESHGTAQAKETEEQRFNEDTKEREGQIQHKEEKDNPDLKETTEQIREAQRVLVENQKKMEQYIQRTKQELQTWVFEHIAREIKGLSAWITAQLETTTATIVREIEGKGQQRYKEIHQSLEVTQRTADTQLKDRLQTIANYLEQTMEKNGARILLQLKEAIAVITQTARKEHEQEEAREEARKRLAETIRNQLYNRLTQEFAVTLQKLENNLQTRQEDCIRRCMEQNAREQEHQRNENTSEQDESRSPQIRKNHRRKKVEEEEEEEEEEEHEEGMNPIKRALIAALKERDDTVTAMKITQIKEMMTEGGSTINENIPILDAIAETKGELWPNLGMTCQLCGEQTLPTRLEQHYSEKHNREMKDELITAAEKMTGKELEEENLITRENRQQMQIARRVHRCHYVGCLYESENYANVLEHRGKHKYWRRRTTILGAFWGKIKQEIELSGQTENLPSMKELMGEAIEYRCSCGYGSYSRDKVMRHKEQKRHHNDIIMREISFRDIQETLLRRNYEEAQPMANPDQRFMMSEMERELQREHAGQEDMKQELRGNIQERTDFIKRILGSQSAQKAARAFINMRYRNREGETYPEITLESPMSELLLQLSEEAFPPVHNMKFCPHCHQLFQTRQQRDRHIKDIANNQMAGLTDIRNMLIRATVGEVKQFATTIFGETLRQEGEIFRCRCPGCNFISLDPYVTERHLMTARDSEHQIFLEETRELGEILAMIRGHIRSSGKMPNVRQFLGDTGTPHRMCNICGEIISINSAESHGRKHEEWKTIDEENRTRLIKIAFTLKEKPQQEEIDRQQEELFMQGTRQTFEEAVDRVYATMMRQSLDEDEHEEEVANQNTQHQQEESETDENRPETQRQTTGMSQELEGTDDEINTEEENTPMNTQEQIFTHITSEMDPQETKGAIQYLLRQLPTGEEWSPEARIIDTIQYLDERILMKFGKECIYCNAKIDTEQGLFTHMKKEHGTPRSDWFILALAEALHKEIKIMTLDSKGNSEEHIISLCHEPGCNFMQVDKEGLKVHRRRGHSEAEEDINKWGILLGTIRRYLKSNYNAKWQDIIHPREAYQCECGAIFKDEAAINKHFSMKHPKDAKSGWRAKYQPVTLKFDIRRQQEEGGEYRQLEDTTETRAPERIVPPQEDTEQEQAENQRRNTRPREEYTETQRNTTTRRPQNDRTNTEDENRREMIEYYVEKRRELMELEDKGVNLRCITKEEAFKVKEGLESLFKNELIPKIEMMLPRSEDHEEWLAFEGAYLECLDIIRGHIAKVQEIPAEKIYRHSNPPKTIDKTKMQQMAEQRTNKLISKLRKWMRQEVEDITTPEGNPRENRKRTIRHTKICHVMNMLQERGSLEIDVTPEDLIRQINDTPEQRQRIMLWLDELFTYTLTKAQKTAQTAKEIRDAYQEDPKTAMKRYIINHESPQCAIDTTSIQRFYEAVWAASATPFTEAQEGNPFHVEKKCQASDDDIKERLMDKQLIAKIVKSRRKLSANGPDGIGYRIYQLGGSEAIKFLRILFQAIWVAQKVPTTWKMAKTILLYKKGDEGVLSNWRPISLTNCTYRIFTAIVAEVIQERNRAEAIFSNVQKGFIARCNGCTEHSIMVNELFNNARRERSNIIAMTIDCTNAFGSVPMKLITSTLRQRGIPETLINIIKDTYEGASTKISTLKGTTERILWRKGVKQGCPLSPLLFNLCLEPLFAAFRKVNADDGIIRWVKQERIQIQAQAYADDIILIADNVKAMNNLIKTTEEFLRWSQMEVNTKKCFVSSYVEDENRHRATITELLLNGEPVRCLTLDESMQYLGVAVAARRKVRFKNNESAVETFLSTLEKIARSPLAITQKIHAIRMFLMPTLDYVLLNGEMRQSTATKLDKRVRATICTLIEARGIPKALIHASWKDGGLSIPSVRDRQNVLTIRAFIQMLNSQDGNVRNMMRKAAQDERVFRKIEESQEGRFLGWKDEDGGQRSGTGTITIRARKANEELGTRITVTEEEINVTIGTTPFIQQENKRKTLGWFITNAIIRPGYIKELKRKETKGDQFEDLINNRQSNSAMAQGTPIADNITRFMIAGRCDLLPTPNNIATWTGGEKPTCTCGKRENAQITLKHILNDCGFYVSLYMERHNRVMEVIRDVIANRDEVEILAEDSQVDVGLRLKPDLVIRNSEQIVIVDATCSYGGSILQHTEGGQLIKRGRNLEKAFAQKIEKYEPLKRALMDSYRVPVEILPIVVSSLGIVYKGTIMEMKRILKISKRKLAKTLRKLSRTAVEGSYKIWLTRRKEQNEGDENKQGDDQLHEDREDSEEEEGDEEEDINHEDLAQWPREAAILYRDTL